MRRADLSIEQDADGRRHARLSGTWTLSALLPDLTRLETELAAHGRDASLGWDLRHVDRIDSVGVRLLWRAWGKKLPASLAVTEEQQRLFAPLAESPAKRERTRAPVSPLQPLIALGDRVLAIYRHLSDALALTGQLALDVWHTLRFPAEAPLREFSASLYKAGVRAMPVTALVGFLIGVVLSYLSALQLRTFGADIFIINILGLGITRELGPVLVAVLVAGRSGSAMTAQLGVMRVTEEIDALATMGVSRTHRLVLPKVAALAVAMPLLVLWSIGVAMIGGMVSAQVQLGISVGFFFETLPKVVPVANLWIALAKGVVFGIIIALVACHFGLRVRPNTESLSSNTTFSVVTAITAVILADAVFAIATREIGLPR